MKEYIEREALLSSREKAIWVYENANILNAKAIREALKPLLDDILNIPTAEVVSKTAFEQVVWERDTALRQLREDYGVGLCEKKRDVVEVRHGEWVGRQLDAAQIMGYEVIEDSKEAEINQFKPDQTAKADAGKARLSLVPFQIVYDIARVREYGDRKYGSSDNWKQVEPQRYVDALLRHALAFASDINSIDEESGLPHLWHAACNLAFLCEMLKGEYDAKCICDQNAAEKSGRA